VDIPQDRAYNLDIACGGIMVYGGYSLNIAELKDYNKKVSINQFGEQSEFTETTVNSLFIDSSNGKNNIILTKASLLFL